MFSVTISKSLVLPSASTAVSRMVPRSRIGTPSAEIYGYTVIDPLSVMQTHLSEVVRSHAYELLGRSEVITDWCPGRKSRESGWKE